MKQLTFDPLQINIKQEHRNMKNYRKDKAGQCERALQAEDSLS